MHEVIIIAKFTTGTTIGDPAKAEAHIKQLLLEGLAKDNFAQQLGHSGPSGLFEVEVIRMRPPKQRGRPLIQRDN